MISLKLVEMRWLCIMFAIMLNISSNAQAVIESIPAETKWCLNNSYVAQDCSYPTDLAAAQATVVSFQSPGVWVITGCSGIGSCDATYSLNGFVVGVYSQWLFQQMSTCPVPATYSEISYQLDTASRMCSRVIPCAPPDVIDPATGQCVHCAIEALKPLPADACTQALENLSSTQAQKDAACGTLTPALRAGKDCLKNKLSAATDLSGISFVNTGGIRSLAYQAHFREVWDKMEEVVDEMERDPTMQTACAARRAEIAAEKGCDNAGPCESCFAQSATQRSHCLNGRPARANPNDAKHTTGNAFDVSRSRTINPLIAALAARRPPIKIPQLLDAPPSCGLTWGGTFINNYDPVHFFVP